MFQRFTDRARSVVVAAREEAVAADAPTIGAHHLLLGVLRDPDSLAMRVLAELGADAEAVRSAVNRHSVGARAGAPAAGALDEADLAALRSIGIDAEEVLRRMATDLGGLPPRSPDERARRLPMAADGKKVLELALREAISMKHGYIGTEHLLLGLLRGRAPIVAATADELGLTHDDVRAVVLATLRRTG